MQLTKRFFVMNTLAVLVSILFTVLAVILFTAAYTKLIAPSANNDDWKKMFEVRSGLGQIKNTAMNMPFEQLLEQPFQQELSHQVKALGADALIIKNREVLYSTKKWKEIDIEKSLLLSDQTPDIDTLELEGGSYMFARTDYRLYSGDKGILLLLAPLKLKTDFYLSLGIFTVSCFILSFLFTNFWVSHRFSRGIIAPVVRLKDAAVKISEGDLSGGIAEEGEGEVKELCRALESMRIKLKESIYLQTKYDENRRFLISSISHDLKTPVTSIRGYIEGILDGVAKTPEKQQAYLDTARSKAMLVNGMIDDLLLYSKLDLNQIPFHFERTELVPYFEDCVSDYTYEYEKANIQLSLINELEGNVHVSIDRERMGRVIQNLLDNAKKFLKKTDG